MRNIAATATATQSSLSKWSHCTKEAQNVLTGDVRNGYAFHTNFEVEPWIRIELQQTYVLCGLKIFPRQIDPNKYCPHIDIYVSTNGISYQCVYSNSEIFLNPYKGIFIDTQNIHARFIVIKSKNCMLSLSQIEVLIDDELIPFRNINIFKTEYHSPQILQLLECNSYEKQEIDIALNTVQKEDRVLELGANIGVMATVIMKNIEPQAYYAAEANPNLIPEIKKNLSINKISGCTIINRIFTHGEECLLDFYINKRNILASSLFLEEKNEIVQIKTQPINDFIKENNINYIISDIEGGEYLIFNEDFDFSTIRTVCIEIHPAVTESVKKLFETFEKNGFISNLASPIEEIQKNIVVLFERL